MPLPNLGARVHPNLYHYHRTGGPLLSHRPYQHIVGRVAVSLIASAAYQFFFKKKRGRNTGYARGTLNVATVRGFAVDRDGHWTWVRDRHVVAAETLGKPACSRRTSCSCTAARAAQRPARSSEHAWAPSDLEHVFLPPAQAQQHLSCIFGVSLSAFILLNGKKT